MIQTCCLMLLLCNKLSEFIDWSVIVICMWLLIAPFSRSINTYLLTFLHGLAPQYLSDYFQHVAFSNRRRLRSSSSLLLIRRTRLITVGDRAFPVAGSRLWNTSLRQLRLLLFSESGSKLIFSLVRSHCNWHTMYRYGILGFNVPLDTV